MKKRYFIMFTILLLILGMGGCKNANESSSQNPEPLVAESPTQIEKSPMSMYHEILLNKANFYSTDAKKELSITDLNQAVSSDDSVKAEVLKFAVVNLENDDIPEVILWLKVNEDDYFGFEVLSYKEGVVYGYTLWYRAFMDLKEDGTFSFSGGSSDFGYGTIKFTENGYTIENLTYTESTFDGDNNEIISYYVNKENATEEEYQTAINIQSEKPDAAWYEFTEDNINTLLSDKK